VVARNAERLPSIRPVDWLLSLRTRGSETLYETGPGVPHHETVSAQLHVMIGPQRSSRTVLMAQIFINYRRSDSVQQASRIYSWLKANYTGPVFMDVDGIRAGDNFVTTIKREIEASCVFLAIVGPDWLRAADNEGYLRLENDRDLVRREILSAFDAGLRTIPILVGGASMPPRSELPEALRFFSNLNAHMIGDATFEENIAVLLHKIEQLKQLDSEHSPHETSSPVEVPSELPRIGQMIKKKVCLLGSAGVGKTSLVRRYVYSTYSESYLTTVGVHITRKDIPLRGHEMILMIWDLAGEEEGVPIKETMIEGASGLILVADGCRRISLQAAIDMKQRFRNLLGPVPMVLAVNKVDRYSEWEVDMGTLENLGNSGLTTFTTSAKTGKAVADLFEQIAREMLHRMDES
jgi:small GTP-binding protein